MDRKYKKIVICQLAGMGNMIMAIPTIRAIRSEFPEHYIIFHGLPESNASLLLIENLIDEFYTGKFRPKSKLSVFKIHHILKDLFFYMRNSFDYAFFLFPTSKFWFSGIAFIARVKNRIGHTYKVMGMGKDFF